MTAGTSSSPVVKSAASLPACVLEGVGVVAGRGVVVGDGNGLTLVDPGAYAEGKGRRSVSQYRVPTVPTAPSVVGQ